MFLLLSMRPQLIWLVLTLLFAVAEAVSVGLSSIWFALGALAALLVSLLTANVWAQIGVFVAVSLLSLILFRPLAARLLHPRNHVRTNADRVLGKTGIVTEPIDNLAARGQVKVGGQIWSARSESGQPISAGVEITVLRIEGVRVFVQPVSVPAGAGHP